VFDYDLISALASAPCAAKAAVRRSEVAAALAAVRAKSKGPGNSKTFAGLALSKMGRTFGWIGSDSDLV